MRELSSCLSEYAVQVSDSSCSGYSSSFCVSPSSTPSIQNAVVCSYRTVLSTRKQILVTVTWCKNSLSQGLSIAFGEDPSCSVKLNTNSRLFKKLRGSRSVEFHSCKAEVFWDLSSARYLAGPEPVNGFYVFITFDSEVGLILGDMAQVATEKKMKNGSPVANFSLISRQEHFSGSALFSTRVKFSDSGTTHDVLIRCTGENEGAKCPMLSVFIDKKMEVRVKRLQWNFRGNQTIFLDGQVVDLMWDVHNWLYNPDSGYAVFMFRARNGRDSSVQTDEKALQRGQDGDEFSLMIYACKNSRN